MHDPVDEAVWPYLGDTKINKIVSEMMIPIVYLQDDQNTPQGVRLLATRYSFSRPPPMLPPETESSTEFTKAVVSPAIAVIAPFSLISVFS